MAAAYAALNSLTHIINDIQNHHSPPISLDTQQLQSLLEKVSFLQEFLEAYTSLAVDIDDEADPLEMRIADAAYAAEDVIESYITHLTRYRSTTTHHQQETTTSSSGEGVSFINLYEDLHQVIEEMDLIKKVAVKIEAKKAEVHDTMQINISASSGDVSSTFSSSDVCPDDVVLEIMEKLVGGPPDLHVIPIVGMGGIGKTTLATNVYVRPYIKEYFDICVWATISQQFNTNAILCDLLSQATGKKKKEVSERFVEELGLELYKYLFGRRYLIVMDDMWSIDAWDEIQRFFPNNGNGSRILVTTRLMKLSSQLNYNYIYLMKSLDEVSSWDLFVKTVFGEESCPFELEEIGKKIVESCRGLPLSIVVVGGLLRKVEQSQGCWESIKSNLSSLVNLENDKHCLRLLKMSYDHLPVYLKPCFLHMGVFKEDSEIRVSELTELWVSEGFLKPRNGKNIETIAVEFLVELISRNLIVIGRSQSSRSFIDGLKIHDLLRDLCLRESQKCGFYHVVGEDSPRGHIDSQRRVVIGASTSNEKACVALQSLSRTRSIICENEQVPMCQSFELLRTLHAPGNILKALVFHCINLRYLHVEVDNMSSFLPSLNLMWSLHTLVVSCVVECNTPLEVWKMPQLRHIEFSLGHYLCSPAPSRDEEDDVVVMKNLKTLIGVKNFKLGEEVVARIPNIINLKLRYCGDDDDDYCLSNIEFLCKLESLHISCDKKFSGGVDSPVHKLTFPRSLESLNLVLYGDEFEWEKVMERIASLPLLKTLHLGGGCFGRGKWEVDERQFPSLKYLSLSNFSGLKHWTTQDSSIFPCLREFNLFQMKDLEGIPREIGYTPTLERIKLDYCSESSAISAKEIVEEQMELQGDDLPFYVELEVFNSNEAMASLAGPNFHVTDVWAEFEALLLQATTS